MLQLFCILFVFAVQCAVMYALFTFVDRMGADRIDRRIREILDEYEGVQPDEPPDPPHSFGLATILAGLGCDCVEAETPSQRAFRLADDWIERNKVSLNDHENGEFAMLPDTIFDRLAAADPTGYESPAAALADLRSTLAMMYVDGLTPPEAS